MGERERDKQEESQGQRNSYCDVCYYKCIYKYKEVQEKLQSDFGIDNRNYLRRLIIYCL